jgi:hypothetical protein
MPGYPAEFWRAKRVDGLLELFGIAGQARRLILLERAARYDHYADLAHLAEIKFLCYRIVLLNPGWVAASGTSRDVTRSFTEGIWRLPYTEIGIRRQ